MPYRSRLWSAADTNDSRFVSWENFALSRDTDTPVNAQIELRTTGTSVALDLDVLPVGAKDLLSVIYRIRRLRGNGTYTDWEYAAGNYWGTDAICNPSDGGHQDYWNRVLSGAAYTNYLGEVEAGLWGDNPPR